jgi:hypothetical protein
MDILVKEPWKHDGKQRVEYERYRPARSTYYFALAFDG